jgi:chemotaxis protein methyltransferase CheR
VNRALADVAELIRQATGIALPASREAALRGAVNRAAPGMAPDEFVRAISDPVSSRGLFDRLIDEITIQETSFLRDPSQLDALAWHSLLRTGELASARTGTIRVWSVGCATGEEVYTLALLATEAFAPQRPPVDVLGTDISRAALAAAEAGRYRDRAVRGLSPAQRLRFLDRHPDGTYLVGHDLRKHVRFRRHNIVRDSVPPTGEAPFHAIVCRNLLIYFEPAVVARVIAQLERSLCPGGMLVLGAADALLRTGGPPVEQHTRPGLALTPPPKRVLRRPLGRGLTREQRLTAALAAADEGDRSTALAHVASLLAEDPLDGDAYFIQGLVTLEAGDPAAAAVALRRALYADTAFALAAFTLGRAYDTLGDNAAAKRAYQQALRTLNPDDNRHELLLQQIDIGDIAAACRARLGGRA